jgi:hypothetical protein
MTGENTNRSPTIERPLHLGLDDVALAMYYSSQCVDGSAVWSLEDVRSQGNGCLFAAIKSLGSVTYLQKWSLPGGSATLWRGYLHAVQLLNSALASPSESQTDSTLLATIIMSAVEAKAAPSQSTAYWEVHTKGAAALLELRGVDQVTSRLGSALFFQASSHMTTVCILAGRRIPEELHRLRIATRAHLISPAHPLWKYQGAMFRFTDFVAAARIDISVLAVHDVQCIVADALSIYTELQEVFRDASSAWQYERSPSTRFRNLVAYEHVYPTILAAQLWNGYRAAVIILCSVVARIASRLPSRVGFDKPAQLFLDKAVCIIHQIANDTISAVPRPLSSIRSIADRLTPFPPGRGLAQHAPVFQETRSESQAVPIMHGCQLQWSVYFAANCEFVARPVRECLLDILENAARSMEIQQWKVSAKKLRLELSRVTE